MYIQGKPRQVWESLGKPGQARASLGKLRQIFIYPSPGHQPRAYHCQLQLSNPKPPAPGYLSQAFSPRLLAPGLFSILPLYLETTPKETMSCRTWVYFPFIPCASTLLSVFNFWP